MNSSVYSQIVVTWNFVVFSCS